MSLFKRCELWHLLHGEVGIEPDLSNRRPLKSRGSGWAGAVTRLLLRTPLTANQVSVIGVLISLLGAGAFVAAPGNPWLYLAGALAIQLRLLCNLFDGLIAVEGGRKSAHGPLYNEVPDRIEDSVFLAGFGYAAGLLWLGLTCALLAAITAYVRVLGGTLGLAQDFRGPMAKQQRMAALTLGAVAGCAEALWRGTSWSLVVALGLIAAGTFVTIVRRVLGIARRLDDAT